MVKETKGQKNKGANSQKDKKATKKGYQKRTKGQKDKEMYSVYTL